MGKILAIAVGGAAGSLGRYGLAVLADRLENINYPVATLAANLFGCLFIGFCWSIFEKTHINPEFRLFVFTGFLGGFTTFSTYARESIQYFRAGEPMHALSYILVSNMVGLALVAAGFLIAERLFHF